MPSDEVKMLYVGAVNYGDAVLLINENAKSTGRDGLILPTHTLLGLTIEMLFKAVFLHRGGDPNKLKEVKVRHNLKALCKLALDRGFVSRLPEIAEIVEHIGDNYAAHEYRYLKANSTLNKVDLDASVPVLQSFIDEIAVEVGLPKRPEPSS